MEHLLLPSPALPVPLTEAPVPTAACVPSARTPSWPGDLKGWLTALFLAQCHLPGWREAPVQPSLAGLPRCDLQETPWTCLLGVQAVLPLPAAKKVSKIQFRSQYLGFTLKGRDLFRNLSINRCGTEMLISFKTLSGL